MTNMSEAQQAISLIPAVLITQITTLLIKICALELELQLQFERGSRLILECKKASIMHAAPLS
jgi:hypothetical protein